MITLSTFVLIGTVVSHDTVLATVEFELNPPTNGDASIGILTLQSIPCEVKVGKKVYVVKHENQEYPVITCELEKVQDEQHSDSVRVKEQQ